MRVRMGGSKGGNRGICRREGWAWNREGLRKPSWQAAWEKQTKSVPPPGCFLLRLANHKLRVCNHGRISYGTDC